MPFRSRWSRGYRHVMSLMTCALVAACDPNPAAEAPASTAVGTRASPISVGPEVMVSRQDSLVAHSEYMADIDPDHPERLLACDQPFVPALNERKNSLFASFDGGRTWELAKEDLAARGGLIAGDPVCMFALGETALFVTLVQDEEE